MLRQADDFLIDRVFQLIADWLSPWVSIRRLVFFFSMGGTAVLLAYGTYHQRWVQLCLILVLSVVQLRTLSQVEPPDGVLPAARINCLPRIVDWIIIVTSVIQMMPLVLFAGFVAWLIGDYFNCCYRNPPIRRQWSFSHA